MRCVDAGQFSAQIRSERAELPYAAVQLRLQPADRVNAGARQIVFQLHAVLAVHGERNGNKRSAPILPGNIIGEFRAVLVQQNISVHLNGQKQPIEALNCQNPVHRPQNFFQVDFAVGRGFRFIFDKGTMSDFPVTELPLHIRTADIQI